MAPWQSDILTVYQTQFFPKLHTSKSKTDCVFKNYLESNDHQRIEWNASSFKVLGAIGTRSFGFGKPCKCIHKSQLGSWKSSSNQSFDSITVGAALKNFPPQNQKNS
jgi:hypothetical protein